MLGLPSINASALAPFLRTGSWVIKRICLRNLWMIASRSAGSLLSIGSRWKRRWANCHQGSGSRLVVRFHPADWLGARLISATMASEASSSMSHHALGLVLASNWSTSLAVTFFFRVVLRPTLSPLSRGSWPSCSRRWFLKNSSQTYVRYARKEETHRTPSSRLLNSSCRSAPSALRISDTSGSLTMSPLAARAMGSRGFAGMMPAKT